LLIMRHSLLGLLVVLGLSAIGSEARAQVGGGINDPFFAYYSFYLPRQQAQALQPGPEATINNWAAQRQVYAATNRNGMFDPNSSATGSLDFGDDFLSKPAGLRRNTAAGPGGRAVHGGNLNGLGPQGYYSARLNTYYPNIRTGRGRNANIATIKGRGGYGGGGMANQAAALPGPR